MPDTVTNFPSLYEREGSGTDERREKGRYQ